MVQGEPGSLREFITLYSNTVNNLLGEKAIAPKTIKRSRVGPRYGR